MQLLDLGKVRVPGGWQEPAHAGPTLDAAAEYWNSHNRHGAHAEDGIRPK